MGVSNIYRALDYFCSAKINYLCNSWFRGKAGSSCLSLCLTACLSVSFTSWVGERAMQVEGERMDGEGETMDGEETIQGEDDALGRRRRRKKGRWMEM